jgi:hypothetical protein
MPHDLIESSFGIREAPANFEEKLVGCCPIQHPWNFVKNQPLPAPIKLDGNQLPSDPTPEAEPLSEIEPRRRSRRKKTEAEDTSEGKPCQELFAIM